MRRNKKGDLSLSINAIVVLILAITMLGLGLAFMRNIFGSATKEFQEVGGTVKKQMIDQMKESTKTVDLSRPKVALKGGEETQVFIGFKNDGQKIKKFKILDLTTSSPLGGAIACNRLKGVPIASTPNGEVYLEYKTAETSVLSGDVTVLPINVRTSSNIESDTCFYELKIQYSDKDDGGVIEETVTTELTVDITT